MRVINHYITAAPKHQYANPWGSADHQLGTTGLDDLFHSGTPTMGDCQLSNYSVIRLDPWYWYWCVHLPETLLIWLCQFNLIFLFVFGKQTFLIRLESFVISMKLCSLFKNVYKIVRLTDDNPSLLSGTSRSSWRAKRMT